MTNPFELFLPGDYVRMSQTIEDACDKDEICIYLGRADNGKYMLRTTDGDDDFMIDYQSFFHVNNQLSEMPLTEHIKYRLDLIDLMHKGITELMPNGK
jgi:hypothetical protein